MRIRLSIVALAAAAALSALCGCSGAPAPTPVLASPEPGRIPDDIVAITLPELKLEGDELYRVGIGDGVSIHVANFPDFSTTASIRPDGRITMPLIGDVEVVDLTPQEVSEKVNLRLRDYIRQDLLVTTTVTGFNSKKYYVFGEVGTKGPTPYTGRVTLVDAVSRAGFDRLRSRLSSVIVYREGKRLIVPNKVDWRGRIKDSFDIDSAMSEGNIVENIVIRENDVVFVPRTFSGWFSDQVDEVLMPFSTAMRIVSSVNDITNIGTTFGGGFGGGQ